MLKCRRQRSRTGRSGPQRSPWSKLPFGLALGLLPTAAQSLTGIQGPKTPYVQPGVDLRWHPQGTTVLGSLAFSDGMGLSLTNPFDRIDPSFGPHTSAFERHVNKFRFNGFEKSVQSFFRELGVHPMIQMKSSDVTSAGFRLQGDSNIGQGQSLDHRFFFQGVPLCGIHARSHKLTDGSGLLMGEVPGNLDIDPNQTSTVDHWPDLRLTQDFFERTMLFAEEDPEDALTYGGENTSQTANNQRWIKEERCFLVKNQKLQPVWNLTVRMGGVLYAALADDQQVHQLQPQFFAVDGKGTTWAHNRSTPPTAERALYGLIGDGTLSSELLRTVVPPEIPKAREPNHIFNYPPSDRRIEEVTAYANGQDHLRWFQGLGFTWYGVKPLELRIHYKPQNKPNNALFEPGDETTNVPPTITIDDGDGSELQNLVTDGDVVSHELGHHVLFKTLKTVMGESLVLHEGLSDYFVFARTGDACLGETICPPDSGQCQLRGKCLRSAANRLVYKDEMWQAFSAGRSNQLGHLHGQLISGMMWDLQKSELFPGNELPQLSMKAASLFAENSNFCQFIRALYAADRELFAGRHLEAIKSVAQIRGLGEFTDPGKDCPSGSLRNVEQNVSTSQSKKSKTKVQCGTVASYQSDKATPRMSLVASVLLPVMAAAFALVRRRPTKL